MEHTTQKPIISIDLDEVLSETFSFFIKTGEKHGLRPAQTNIYHSSHWFDATQAETEKIITQCEDLLHEAEPLANAVEVVRHLAYHYELSVVTGRSEQRNWLSTDIFLDRYYRGCFSGVEFCERESGIRPKSQIIREIGAFTHIDDLPEYVLEIAEAGIHVVYLNCRHPWQYEIEHPLVTTIRHWNEAPLALLSIAEDAACVTGSH